MGYFGILWDILPGNEKKQLLYFGYPKRNDFFKKRIFLFLLPMVALKTIGNLKTQFDREQKLKSVEIFFLTWRRKHGCQMHNIFNSIHIFKYPAVVAWSVKGLVFHSARSSPEQGVDPIPSSMVYQLFKYRNIL